MQVFELARFYHATPKPAARTLLLTPAEHLL